MEQPVYMADIQNKIYEAGLIRQEERIVLTAENCVLLEYYTGKTYSYRMVELSTLKAKRLFSKAAPLNESGYQKAMDNAFAGSIGTGKHLFHQACRESKKFAGTHFFKHSAGTWYGLSGESGGSCTGNAGVLAGKQAGAL